MRTFHFYKIISFSKQIRNWKFNPLIILMMLLKPFRRLRTNHSNFFVMKDLVVVMKYSLDTRIGFNLIAINLFHILMVFTGASWISVFFWYAKTFFTATVFHTKWNSEKHIRFFQFTHKTSVFPFSHLEFRINLKGDS